MWRVACRWLQPVVWAAAGAVLAWGLLGHSLIWITHLTEEGGQLDRVMNEVRDFRPTALVFSYVPTNRCKNNPELLEVFVPAVLPSKTTQLLLSATCPRAAGHTTTMV